MKSATGSSTGSAEPVRTLRRARQGQVLILVLIGAALAVTVWQSFTSVAEVSRSASLGLGESFMNAVRETFRPGHASNKYVLKRVLEENWERGLRCIVVLAPGDRVGQRAGSCETPDSALPELMAQFRPGDLTSIGARLRMLHRPPPPPPPPPGAPGWRPPGRPPRGPGRSILIEFEPVLGRRMHAVAVRTLLIGIATLVALAASAFGSWKLSVRAEQLQASREGDRRLAMLGEMSAVVAHELRNPLASLKGHAQLLSEALPEGRERSKADRVVREAVRLEDLCEDLLSFVRSDRIEPREVDAVALLREAAEAVGAERLRLVTPPATIRWRLDPVRMHQLLTNVLRNAVQAEADGRPPEASVAVEDGELIFRVRDFGSGIAAENLESIFDPFVTSRARGTGLGLAVARRIAILHGGRITATNEAQGGALFRICIPPDAGRREI